MCKLKEKLNRYVTDANLIIAGIFLLIASVIYLQFYPASSVITKPYYNNEVARQFNQSRFAENLREKEIRGIKVTFSNKKGICQEDEIIIYGHLNNFNKLPYTDIFGVEKAIIRPVDGKCPTSIIIDKTFSPHGDYSIYISVHSIVGDGLLRLDPVEVAKFVLTISKMPVEVNTGVLEAQRREIAAVFENE